MKFVTKFCPICSGKLAKDGKTYYCIKAKSDRDIEDAEPDKLKMPQTHKYEVFKSKSSWLQNVDVPPFAIDSECAIEGGEEQYRSILYKWNDDHTDETPGWQEVGDFPYIETDNAAAMIARIKKLLPFI